MASKTLEKVVMRILRIGNKVTVLLLVYAFALTCYIVPYGWGGVVVLLIAMVSRKARELTSYGSARFASFSELRHLRYGYGLIIGFVDGKLSRMEGLRALFSRRTPDGVAVTDFLETCQGVRTKPKNLIRLNDANHTTVFAPTRAGKGASLIIPELLTNPETFFVLDPKGENYKITAAHRAKVFGQDIAAIDPFRLVTQSPIPFNVMNGMDPDDPDVLAQIRAVCESIVQKEPNSKDPHWVQKAEIFIGGAMAAVIHSFPPEHRSLQEVASIMADKRLLTAAIKTLQQSKAHGGLLARRGHEMANSTDKELDGILSTANRALAVLSDPAIVESTRGMGGFNPDRLRNTTAYFVMPVQYLRSHAGITRLWMTALMRSIVSRGVENPTPVNLVLDEASTLGPLETIKDMMTIGAGFGLKITLIYQSMGQLLECWPNGQHQTLLSNSTQIFFAVRDSQTATYVSDFMGDHTMVVQNDSDGVSSSTKRSPHGGSDTDFTYNKGTSRQQIARRLLKPEEVLSLDPRIAITFSQGVRRPIASYLVRYYESSFGMTQRMGLLKATVSTVCMFLAVAFLATIATATIYYQR